MKNKDAPTVLLIEDSPSLALIYKNYLTGQACQVVHCENGKSGLAFIEQTPPQVILLDLNLPDISGLDILKVINEKHLSCSVIVVTSNGSVTVAVEAMSLGAFDFLEKPFDAERLSVTVANALERQRLTHTIDAYKNKLGLDSFHGYLGASLAMQAVYQIIKSAAASKASVFIVGESGTGKEVAAQAIHQEGPRSEQPMIVLNCAAIPHELMESEIFGHVKGAFTGAVNNRDGAATLADGGILFLDEICEMDVSLQSKLLRFIRTGTFQRVGGVKLESVDIRFICATNKDPVQEVQAGRFREDLFYRLHVIPVELPPLRERDQDILLIANKFLLDFSAEEEKLFTCFDEQAKQLLLHYAWPGNVRELQNVIRNLVVLNVGEEVSAGMLPQALQGQHNAFNASGAEVQLVDQIAELSSPLDVIPLWLVEKKAIEAAIVFCDGNIPKAAALLDVSPSTIYRKKQTWDELAVTHSK